MLILFAQDGASLVIGDGLADGDRIIVSALDYPVDGMALALESDKPKDDSQENPEESTSETQVASVATAGE